MIRKAVFSLVTLGFLAAAGVVLAQTAPAGTPAATSATPPEPMVLQVGPQGRALLRGTIDSVSASSITVKSWGGDWTVAIPSTAEVVPKGAALASFQQGDFVGIQGTIDPGSSWTIDASLVRDWTARQTLNQEIKQNVQSVREEMQTGTPRTLQGAISALSGQSFTLTAGNGTVYTVTLAAGAKVLQKNWLSLDFSQVQNGDTVRVWGPVTNTTVTASIFRDISVPRS